MGIDRTSGSRETDFQAAQRQGEAKGGAGFAAAMKRKDDDKKAGAKDDKKAEKKDEAKDAESAEGKDAEGKVGPDGHPVGQGQVHGHGHGQGQGHGGQGKGDGKGGEGHGQRGDGAPGKGKVEAPLGKKGEAAGKLGDLQKSDSLGGMRKSGEFSAVLAKRGQDAEQVNKTNQKDDIAAAKRIDKPGEVASADLSKKQDVKSMQEEIAKHMFPGEIVHPFLLQQVAPVEQVQKAQPVIQPEIVDKIVERARFGMNAEGAHEFQIDLKQDVYAGSQLKIATKDGKVSVEVIADNAEVARSFEARAQEIAKSLGDRGLNVQTVNVTVKENARTQQQAPRDGMAGAGGSKARQQALDNQRGSGRDYSA
ncbi:MAG TPA: hypothetical protein VHF22_06510 [Planctomycetota bacterium]|nr:hypothetical protein [Planctomycetota bacterium]